MSMDFKVRTWLWVALATVVVLGGGFTWWYTKGSKSVISPTTSPTPTKSVALSPSVGITTSPTSGKTSTPSGNQTPTPSATSTPTIASTPPSDWKYDSRTLRAHGTLFTGQYTILVKNDWIFRENTMNPELGQYALGDQADCGSNWEWPGCAVVVTFKWGSTTTENNVYWTTDHKGYFTLTFPNNNLPESDRKMVTDNFSAGGTGTI